YTSLRFMVAEVWEHLEGKPEELSEALPFRNFVAQSRRGASREDHERYFREMLGSVEEPTAPFGLIDAQGDGSGIEETWVDLAPGLSERLRERARKLGVSAASLCHLAWGA